MVAIHPDQPVVKPKRPKKPLRLLEPFEVAVRDHLQRLLDIYRQKVNLTRLNDKVTPVEMVELRVDFANVINIYENAAARLVVAFQRQRLHAEIDSITIRVQTHAERMLDLIIDDRRPLYARATFEIVRDWCDFLTMYRDQIAYLRERGL